MGIVRGVWDLDKDYKRIMWRNVCFRYVGACNFKNPRNCNCKNPRN